MLLRTLFALLLLAVLGETIAHGVQALAQTMLKRQARVAVQAQLLDSIAQTRQSIAAAIAAGGDPGQPPAIAPTPAAACRLSTAHGCAIQAAATISFEAALSPSGPPCPNGACTTYAQGNDAVAEGRVDAEIFVRALVPATGAVLASRNVRVTFRTQRVAPYATIAGRDDETLDALSAGGNGIDAGAAPNGTAPGTLVDVLYENKQTGVTMPGNVWQANVGRPDAGAPAWSP